MSIILLFVVQNTRHVIIQGKARINYTVYSR